MRESLPGWWLNASGMFFVLGSIAFVACVILLTFLIYAVMQLHRQVVTLTNKIDEIGNSVKSTARTIEKTTEEVGIRVSGITGVVDESASRAFGLIDRVVPYLLGIGLFWRLKTLISRR